MVEDEDTVKWRIARPGYMREIEPGSCYWQTKKRSAAVTAAEVNLELFEKKKITTQSYRKRAVLIALEEIEKVA